ncbi:MAG TPA: hypothetical protein VGG72_28430 [Bryobacteraceae bacterium]
MDRLQVTGADAPLVGTALLLRWHRTGLAAPGTQSHSASVAIVTIEN